MEDISSSALQSYCQSILAYQTVSRTVTQTASTTRCTRIAIQTKTTTVSPSTSIKTRTVLTTTSTRSTTRATKSPAFTITVTNTSTHTVQSTDTVQAPAATVTVAPGTTIVTACDPSTFGTAIVGPTNVRFSISEDSDSAVECCEECYRNRNCYLWEFTGSQGLCQIAGVFSSNPTNVGVRGKCPYGVYSASEISYNKNPGENVVGGGLCLGS
ncbi:hypothetical protein C8J56DRAFT_1064727 [Mycena floridula]|nr:hypothetical protein C8J56DRAFT_1064727 [Mycena floridula]